MPITFTCACGRTYQVRDELAGANAICRDCGSPFIIPAAPACVDDLAEVVAVPDEPAAEPAAGETGGSFAPLPFDPGGENAFTYPCPNPECDAILASDPEDIGKPERCPSCRRRFIVPKPEPPGRQDLITALCVGAAALVALGVVLAALFLGGGRGGDPAPPSGRGGQVAPIAEREAAPSAVSDPRAPKAGRPTVPTVPKR